MNISDFLLKMPGIISISKNKDLKITSVAYDSRKVIEGSLFVAIPGFKFDGHDFISEAINKGAAVIVGEKELDLGKTPYIRVKDSREALSRLSSYFYKNPGDKLKIIGVTGTNGKTTTTYLLKAILDEVGIDSGVIGTIGNMIKNKLVPTMHTTPESLELYQLFYNMLKKNISHVVMEVSSHSLKLKRVDDVPFEIGVFTNLTQDHLDFHRNFEDYYESKKRLFDLSKSAVINIDDKSGKRLFKDLKIPIVTYGISSSADVKAQNIKNTRSGVTYDINIKGKIFSVDYKVPGLFSVYNSLAAITTGLVLGLSPNILIKAIKKVKGVPGRLEPVDRGQSFGVFVDYAHTPDSLENVLKTVKSFCKGEIIVVFGCGGERDRSKRPVMGKIASDLADYVVITSDNPRSEDAQRIIDDIEKGIIKNNYDKIVNRKNAIKKAIEMANKDDIVVIAGKGHETCQILKDKVIPFDDREIASNFLDRRQNNEGNKGRGYC